MNHVIFLQAIRANPDDDGPRLVYADWLEERGECDRAEFIRVQCELEYAPDDQRWEALTRRAAELLTAHEEEWLGRWPRRLLHPVRRGFSCMTPELGHVAQVTEADLTLPLLLDWELERENLSGDPGLLRFATAVRLTDGGADAMRDLLGSSDWPRLTSLTATCAGAREAVARIDRLPALCRLTVTDSACDAYDAGRLLTTLPPGRLTALSLACRRLGPTGAAMVARCPTLAGLRELDLSGSDVRDTGARAIAVSPNFENLRSLRLRNDQIGRPGLTALLSGPVARRLTALAIGHNFLGRASLRVLLDSTVLPQLTELDFGNDLQDDDLATLSESPAAAGLRRLGLHGHRLGGDGIRALAESPVLNRLTHLTLDFAELVIYGSRRVPLTGLAETTGLFRLTDLELQSVRVRPAMAERLLTTPRLPRLRRLRVPGVDPWEAREALEWQFGDRIEF
ncbi:MAG: TIGR02996 domain-containing protein [Gemmataceae bacterium]